jgi:bacterioferritin-associated ferredoxin
MTAARWGCARRLSGQSRGWRGCVGDLDGSHGRAAAGWPVVAEHADCPGVGSCCAGCEHAAPAVVPECLADVLVGRPVASAGAWSRKVYCGQSLGCAQVGECQVDAPDVVVVGDSGAGWQSAFGEVAVPLGDRGGPVCRRGRGREPRRRAASGRRWAQCCGQEGRSDVVRGGSIRRRWRRDRRRAPRVR